MKNTLVFLLLTSTSFAFELSFDTITTGESKTLFVNTTLDTIRFDSTRVDLLKSTDSGCEMIMQRLFTDNTSGNNSRDSMNTLYFSNYGKYGGDFQARLNNFYFAVNPNETVSIRLESFDYRLFAILPAGSVATLSPPQPMQAKMVFFTNKGIDSILINGTQTKQPPPDAIVNRQMFAGKAGNGRSEHEYYTINGKLVNSSSIKKTGLFTGIGIILQKHPDGRVVYKKSLLTR